MAPHLLQEKPGNDISQKEGEVSFVASGGSTEAVHVGGRMARKKHFRTFFDYTRKGSILVKSEDENGKRHTHYCVEKNESAVINGERLTALGIAKAYAQKIKDDYHRLNLGSIKVSEDIEILKEKFLEFHIRQRHSPRHLRHLEIDVRRAIEAMNLKVPADISEEKLKKWSSGMVTEGIAHETQRNRLAGFSNFCKWLISEKYLSVDPFVGGGIIPGKKANEPRYWTSAQFFAFDKAAEKINHHVQVGARLAYTMGLRKCEIVGHENDEQGVLWEDITWKRNGDADLLIRKEVAKGGATSRSVVIPPRLVALLGSKGHGPLIPMTRFQFDHIFARIKRQAGLRDSNLTFHGLRHSFAKNTLQSGQENLTGLKTLMGHADVRTTQIYSQFEKSYLRESVVRADEWQAQEEALIAREQNLADALRTSNTGNLESFNIVTNGSEQSSKVQNSTENSKNQHDSDEKRSNFPTVKG